MPRCRPSLHAWATPRPSPPVGTNVRPSPHARGDLPHSSQADGYSASVPARLGRPLSAGIAALVVIVHPCTPRATQRCHRTLCCTWRPSLHAWGDRGSGSSTINGPSSVPARLGRPFIFEPVFRFFSVRPCTPGATRTSRCTRSNA